MSAVQPRARILVVTNDFPPRQGGIQTYVASLLEHQDPDSIVVFASDHPGAAEHDAQLPYPVIRDRRSLILPTPRIRRRVTSLAREYGATRAWFGAAVPLAALTPALRRAGVERVMASTHGHEAGLVGIPAVGQGIGRLVGDVDVATYITEFTRSKLAPALLRDVDHGAPPDADRPRTRPRLEHLPPGVDIEAFHPGIDPAPLRRRLGIDDGPVVVCVSRLVRRKGQDVLIRAWPAIRERYPTASLLLVGTGPDEDRLRRQAAELSVGGVHLIGGVDYPDLPTYYAVADVFAMPCRTRRAGLDVEGLGMVYLEAAACGVPVVAGTSGGAPEAVRHERTGLVVDDPHSPDSVAGSILRILADPVWGRELGRAGRDWVERDWAWPALARRWRELLG